MKELELLHLNDAAGKKNRFNLSRTHLTTMEIGDIVPILHEELVPGDTINVGESIFSRMAPLAVPTYGSFQFKTASMFVPYYQIFEGAEAFFAGKSISRGKTISMPYITKEDLVRLFSALSTDVTNPSSTAAYDFTYSLSGVVTYKKLTRKGRRIYKVLRSLGYQIPCLVSSTGVLSGAPNASDKLNALPILCYLKAYNDYMSQSQRFDTSELSSYLEGIRTNTSLSADVTSGNHLVYGSLSNMLSKVVLQYENDYFTSCWASPNNAIGDNTGSINGVDYYYSDTTGVKSIAGTLYNNNAPIQSSTISQRALDFLGAFDRWIRRNNYSGSRDVEKIYSRFGIKPEDFKAQYAHLVNTASTPIQVGDVTSLTDSKTADSGMVLGDFAGKGIVNGDSGYKYTSDDFGMLITLAWISVKPTYSNGMDRTVLKYNALDWFNPEFDALGGNPVSHQEVYVDSKNPTKQSSKDNTVFGFNERYAEYKTGNRNQITGDFCLYEDMSSWHFDRTDLQALEYNNALTAQDNRFNSYNVDSPIYNRIFNSEIGEDSMADHFYVTAQFAVEAFRPMKNLNEVPNLGTGDTVVPRNGNTLN